MPVPVQDLAEDPEDVLVVAHVAHLTTVFQVSGCACAASIAAAFAATGAGFPASAGFPPGRSESPLAVTSSIILESRDRPPDGTFHGGPEQLAHELVIARPPDRQFHGSYRTARRGVRTRTRYRAHPRIVSFPYAPRAPQPVRGKDLPAERAAFHGRPQGLTQRPGMATRWPAQVPASR